MPFCKLVYVYIVKRIDTSTQYLIRERSVSERSIALDRGKLCITCYVTMEDVNHRVSWAEPGRGNMGLLWGKKLHAEKESDASAVTCQNVNYGSHVVNTHLLVMDRYCLDTNAIKLDSLPIKRCVHLFDAM